MAKKKAKKTTKRKSNAGRPEMISQEILKRITEALKMGSSIEAAAAYAGVSKHAVYKWLKAGRQGKAPIYRQFVDAVEHAMDYSEIYHLNKIDQLSKDNWQCSKWILEQRFPTRYGKKLIAKIEEGDSKDSSFKDKSLNDIIADALVEVEEDRWQD